MTSEEVKARITELTLSRGMAGTNAWIYCALYHGGDQKRYKSVDRRFYELEFDGVIHPGKIICPVCYAGQCPHCSKPKLP